MIASTNNPTAIVANTAISNVLDRTTSSPARSGGSTVRKTKARITEAASPSAPSRKSINSRPKLTKTAQQTRSRGPYLAGLRLDVSGTTLS